MTHLELIFQAPVVIGWHSTWYLVAGTLYVSLHRGPSTAGKRFFLPIGYVGGRTNRGTIGFGTACIAGTIGVPVPKSDNMEPP